MKAITFHGTGDVRVESVADPAIKEATDAVVRITTSAVCGSDLHLYHSNATLTPTLSSASSERERETFRIW